MRAISRLLPRLFLLCGLPILASEARAQSEITPVGIRPRIQSPYVPCPPGYPPGMPWSPSPVPKDPSRPTDPSRPDPSQPPQTNMNQDQQQNDGRGAALASGEGALPNIIGDLLNPDELLPFPPTGSGISAALLAARGLRAPVQSAGFKIAENENVRPMTRIYGSFNYFNNVNGRLFRRLGAEVGQVNAHRETVGGEWAFWNNGASVGVRIPFNTVTITGIPRADLNGTFTSVGDLSFIFKRALYDEGAEGKFVSGGMLLTVPTGQESYGGGGFLRSPRTVFFQPYLGYVIPVGRKLYLQGFSSVAMPTDLGRDVAQLFTDISVGIKAYENQDSDAFLTALTPIFESHLSTPLNHRGALRTPIGAPDSLVLTQGCTFQFRKKAHLTVAISEPISGFAPFDFEAAIQMNWRF